MAGVNNTLQVIEAAESIGVAVVGIFKDGKVGFDDLLKAWPVVVAGWSIFKSAGSVAGELSDLDTTEINQIGTKAFKAIKTVLEASK